MLEDASELSQALASLLPPIETTPKYAWQTFVNDLQLIMLTYRDLGHEWNLTAEQIKQISRYFEANLLLLECLKLAYVSDRQAIEDSLMLPPGEGR
jgi:hypothetical protein